MGTAIARVLAQHDVVPVTSGRAALARICDGERFDAIFCDLMMPDFNGMDLYEAIALQAAELLDRVVFMTGGAYTEEAVEFLERVPNPRLEKPILPQVLQAVVRSIVEARAAQSESSTAPKG